jgi:glycerol-3-phosphate responsive antiterminator
VGRGVSEPVAGATRLPSILIATDGRHAVRPPDSIDAGVLIRDTDLASFVHRVASDCPPNAVDIDSVAGLGTDDDALAFVMGRLGIGIVLTRRPQVAARVAELGGLGLVHVFAYDSTGMSRSLETHPRSDRVGSVLSPALVILHLQPDELARVPRPVVAYGLIEDVADARACGEFADAIVVRPAVAAKLAAQVGSALADDDRVLLGSSVGSAP